MRLLYISCNPEEQNSLMVEDEINEMTLRISLTPGDRVQSTFLPRCRLEDLATRIAQHRPKVLHIAAHGSDNELLFASSTGESKRLSGQTLKQLLPAQNGPRLVYLNACNSHDIAKELVGRVAIVVATSTPITNRASRAAAGLFYERLTEGCTVQEAFEAAKSLGKALESSCEWTLESAPDCDPAIERFCERLEIVARFSDHPPKVNKYGFYDFDLGVVGCPEGTAQVVLFTDESAFKIDADIDDESDVALEMAMVGLHSLDKGTMWFREQWPSDGDFRLYACAVTRSGEMLMCRSSLVEAIERCYRNTNYRAGALSSEVIGKHLAKLQAIDGLTVHAPRSSPSKAKKSSTRKAAVGTKTKTTKRAAKKVAKRAARK